MFPEGSREERRAHVDTGLGATSKPFSRHRSGGHVVELGALAALATLELVGLSSGLGARQNRMKLGVGDGKGDTVLCNADSGEERLEGQRRLLLNDETPSALSLLVNGDARLLVVSIIVDHEGSKTALFVGNKPRSGSGGVTVQFDEKGLVDLALAVEHPQYEPP